MEFWKLQHPDTALAAVDAQSGDSWTYASLRRESAHFAEAVKLPKNKGLALLVVRNNYPSLVAYLGVLQADCAAILLDAAVHPDARQELIDAYLPDWIYFDGEDQLAGYEPGPSGIDGLWQRQGQAEASVHPDLKLMLTTSGSTGSPKLVRLTGQNLSSNGASIAEYLGLTPEERPITSLPMSYSYGLSVINSHLTVGAAIVLTEDSVLQKGFWEALDRYRCTSLAGVPYTYQMLLQTGLLKSRGSTLKTLTQAGGRLEERYIRDVYALAAMRGWKFFVMYGQTEATARISYVPFDRLGTKVGSVGIPVPNGRLGLDEETHELVYWGPNVMMGYAECRADLAKGDELGGCLRTGDLARSDEDGFFYITGRLKRFLKMFGKRFNLDDAERVLMRKGGTAITCFGRDDLLMAAIESSADRAKLQATICETFDLPRSAVKVLIVSELPRTPNGKTDYKRLAEVAASQEIEGERVARL